MNVAVRFWRFRRGDGGAQGNGEFNPAARSVKCRLPAAASRSGVRCSRPIFRHAFQRPKMRVPLRHCCCCRHSNQKVQLTPPRKKSSGLKKRARLSPRFGQQSQPFGGSIKRVFLQSGSLLSSAGMVFFFHSQLMFTHTRCNTNMPACSAGERQERGERESRERDDIYIWYI